MRARGSRRDECIAVGDSREDLGVAAEVGTFWLVANALERDPTIREAVAGRRNVRVAEAGYGAGRLRGGRHDARRAPMRRLPASWPRRSRSPSPRPRGRRRAGRARAAHRTARALRPGARDQPRPHRRPGRAAQGARRRRDPRQRARGPQVVDLLRGAVPPPGAELLLVRNINPDGLSAAPARTPTASTSTATRRRAGASSAVRGRRTTPARRRSRSPRRAPSAR